MSWQCTQVSNLLLLSQVGHITKTCISHWYYLHRTPDIRCALHADTLPRPQGPVRCPVHRPTNAPNVAGQTDRAKRACKGLLETRPLQPIAALASQQTESLEERLKLYRYFDLFQTQEQAALLIVSIEL